MDWMVRLTDGMTYFAMYLSLTLAYSSRFGRVKTACLLLLFTAAGLGSILLQEMLPAGNFIIYLFSFVLWGCLYAALILTAPFAYKMSMVSVFVATSMMHHPIIWYLISLVAPEFIHAYARLPRIAVVLVSGWFLKENAIHSRRKVPSEYYLGIPLVSLLGLLAYYVIQINLKSSNPQGAAVLATCFLTVTYFVFWLSSRLISRYDTDMMKLSYEVGGQGEQQTVEAAVRLTNEMRAQRHEMRNHLASLSALLSNGRYDKAQALLTDLIGAPGCGDSMINSGNAVADAILNQKAAQAHNLNIPLHIDACLNASLPIQTSDLSSLLGNLLNNALEASQQVNAPEITVRIFPAAGYLCFLVRNRADARTLQNNPQLVTTKDEPEMHGFGLNIIRSIADKYDGKAVFETEGDYFTARIMLALTE